MAATKANTDPKILEARFWSRVDQSGGPDACWPWRGHRQTTRRGNRGIVRRRQKAIYAHRMAFAFSKGPIPSGLCVCHRCDNSICCNPSHLFAGTQQENIADRDRKGRCRASGVRGSRNGNSKLKEAQIPTIVAAIEGGNCSLRSIAKTFGVSETIIRRIKDGKQWVQITKKKGAKS